MKKLIAIIISIILILTSTFAFAKTEKSVKPNEKQQDKITQNKQEKTTQNSQEKTTQNNQQKKEKDVEVKKEKKESFKIAGSPVIKYGRVTLPIRPIEKGIGAKITYDKLTHIITVKKGDITIIINLENYITTVNGKIVESNLKANTNNKTTVLIKFIAQALGVRVEVDKDDITVITPTPTPTATATP